MKLFVSGFPLDMTEMDIVKLFNVHATVGTIKIVRDKKTKRCKGYAFLEMTDQAGADRVIEALDGSPLGDRLLTVRQTAEKVPVTELPYRADRDGRRQSYIGVAEPTPARRNKRPRKTF